MASSGSDVPAARAAVAVNDLIQARDGAARLRDFLLQLELDDQRAAWAQLEIDGVLTRLSSAMSALDVSDAAAAAGGRSAAAGSSTGNKRKQSSSRSRSQRPSDTKITCTLDDDGHVWRKYGQKEIQDSPYPRSYYRCTHKSDQGCSARRQVQRCETDTSKYVVTYYGEHTCRDLSTIPLIDQAAARAEPDGDGHAANNNLISFGPSSGANNAAASSGAGASSSSQYLLAAMMGGSAAAAADQLSTASWCTSDDVFSSSAGSFMQVDELIGAVVGSAGVVTSSAPDRGVLGGVGRGATTAGFPPSSPNSLGFVVGSLGSIGGGGEDDDDMFRLDP